MSLAVVGVGLVSPAGITPRDHAFFLRAGLVVPPPSPFVTADDKRVDVFYCPWLGARLPVGERLVRMARAAAHAAWWDCAKLLQGADVPLFVCASRPRPGMDGNDRDALAAALRAQLRAREAVAAWGAAGAFAALREARQRIDAGARAAMIVAADTHVSTEAIADELAHPPSWWAIDAEPLSEGAAAILVTDERTASRERLPVFGHIGDAQIAAGASNDENDEPADGVGMATALRALPFEGPVHLIFGQYRLDNLRRTEWVFAEARNASRFDPACKTVNVETRIGRLGAAAGLFHLAYGLTVLHHDTSEQPFPEGASMLAWAISRDGTRGIAVAKGKKE